MPNDLLVIDNLHAKVDDTEILKGLDLRIGVGEVHVIMGPNGAGKSTLANIIMGHPHYEVTEGTITFEGENIIDEKTDARARRGIFLSFQTPEEIAGVTVEDFLRAAKAAMTGKEVRTFAFHKELLTQAKELGIDENYITRYLNVGFSGGEKKKNEILQMLALDPKLAILDEADSGLDVDAARIVSEGVHAYKNDENALLIITHNTKILEKVAVDRVHVLVDGVIARTGDASLIDRINAEGFASVLPFMRTAELATESV